MNLKEYSLIIDGGTTNTRFTLTDLNQVIARTECRVGAVNADGPASNEALKQAVKNKIKELKEQNNCKINDIYASGMITSNVGLFELAHIEAPVTLKNLSKGIRSIRMPEICKEAVFHFIPGIRFNNQPFIGTDMLRGEETEIFGAVNQEEDKSIFFLHFGSHNKLMYYNHKAIQNCVTTIGGELLWAILNHTILKSSSANLGEPFILEEEYVKLGFNETRKSHLSRSIFQGRIHQVVDGNSREQILSYSYGAVMGTDMEAFMPLLKQRADRCVLYGREAFIKTFLICLSLIGEEEIAQLKTEIIPYEESEWLSFKGVMKIWEGMEKT